MASLMTTLRLMFGAWLGGVACTQMTNAYEAHSYSVAIAWLAAAGALAVVLVVSLAHLFRR